MGLNLDEPDKRGSTPLLWACYSQSETALTYLLAWNPNVNAQDKEGYTALHLAVRTVEQLESTRPIRALLMKGANPNIKDKNGYIPMDHVEEFKNDDIKPEIRNILKTQNIYKEDSNGNPIIQKTKKKT